MGEPKVLIDFGSYDSGVDTNIRDKIKEATTSVISQRDLFNKEWDALDPFLYRICYYFLKEHVKPKHPLRTRCAEVQRERNVQGIPTDPNDVLRMIVELDEEVFFRKYGKRSTATSTDEYRGEETDIGDEARACLERLSSEQVNQLKESISIMRKYTCLSIMQYIKSEGSYQDAMIDMEATLK